MKWFKDKEQNTESPVKGDLVFKCKRCGELSKLSKDLEEFSLQFQYQVKYEPHKCLDGNIGVMELIGFEIDELTES